MDRQVSSRKRDRACWSSQLYLGFVSTKEKLVCSYKTIHGEKVKSDQKTLCTCHRISGYDLIDALEKTCSNVSTSDCAEQTVFVFFL